MRSAHGKDTGGPADEREMEDALNGSLTAFGSLGKTVWISTPKGQQGLFFERYQQGEGGVLPSTVVLRAPTWEMRPDLPRLYFETRREQQGEDFYRQELGAEFVATGGSFFDLRGVVFEEGPAPPRWGGRWVAGLDPAFHNDKFGLCLVGESMDERGVLLVGAAAGLDPGARLLSLERRRAREDRTLDRVWELIEPYGQVRVVTDQHQGDAIASYFGRRGCRVQVVNLTGPVQTAAFTSTRARLMDGSLRCWAGPDGLLREELARVRVAKDAERIVLARFHGGHLDIASALALATWQFAGLTDAPPGRVVAGGELIASRSEIARVLDGRPAARAGGPGSADVRPAGTVPPPDWVPGGDPGIRRMRF